MSVSSEVQRTLVKSPPELWAELSDPTTLARHLGELGEIRIVRTEPDRAVDWEAAASDGAQTSGRVEIEPSGWGTRVTLSASRVVVMPPGDVSEPESPESDAVEPESSGPVTGEPQPETVEPEPRRGFFARIFRRRHHRDRDQLPTESSELTEIEEPAPEPAAPTAEIEPEADISAELAELEQQTTAVLSGVLDRLGAAHHRPFSRS